MKSIIAIAVLGLLLVSAAEASRRKSEYKPAAVKRQRIISPLPSETIPDSAVPDNWDWRVCFSIQTPFPSVFVSWVADRLTRIHFSLAERLWCELLLSQP